MHLERLVERRFSLFKKKIWFVQMHHNVDHAFSQSIYPFSTSSLLSKKLSAFMHHFNCMHLDLFMQLHSNPRRSQRTSPKAVASSQSMSSSKITNPPNQQQRKHHHHPKRESINTTLERKSTKPKISTKQIIVHVALMHECVALKLTKKMKKNACLHLRTSSKTMH